MAWSDRKLRRRDGRTRPTGFPWKLIPFISASDSVLLSEYIPLFHAFLCNFSYDNNLLETTDERWQWEDPALFRPSAAPLGNACCCWRKSRDGRADSYVTSSTILPNTLQYSCSSNQSLSELVWYSYPLMTASYEKCHQQLIYSRRIWQESADLSHSSTAVKLT